MSDKDFAAIATVGEGRKSEEPAYKPSIVDGKPHRTEDEQCDAGKEPQPVARSLGDGSRLWFREIHGALEPKPVVDLIRDVSRCVHGTTSHPTPDISWSALADSDEHGLVALKWTHE